MIKRLIQWYKDRKALDNFLREMSLLPVAWRQQIVGVSTQLLREVEGEHCPIAAVYAARFQVTLDRADNSDFVKQGKELGLSPELTNRIVVAADSPKREIVLRRRLLHAARVGA